MSTERIQTNLNEFRDRIEELYRFRDEYFLQNSENLYVRKRDVIETKTMKIFEQLAHIDEEEKKALDKAEYNFLLGWLLNIKETYDPRAFEYLTKAIKFDPNKIESWLQLGECYFKNRNLSAAYDCFQKVLEINGSEKRALRNASIILRSMSTSNDGGCLQRQEKIIESIELAKKALKCDLQDYDSWAVLGNSYLTLLFLTRQNSERDQLLSKCKMAYRKALSDRIVQTKSDVLYNYSSVLQLDEEFTLSLQCLSEAYRYDPHWTELAKKKEQIISILNDIDQLKNDKTVIKPKKLNSIKESLRLEESRLQSIYQNDAKFFNGQTKAIDELQEGFNDCLLMTKILSYVPDNHNLFFYAIYLSIDSTGRSIIIFIYDIIKSKGPRPGDNLLIIRPIFKEYSIKFENNLYKWKAIRVLNPNKDLLINNNLIKSECLSMPNVSITLKSD
ncbi:tetratricopeptide repeat protein 5-like protein [Sarcoptes scabiei]|uniref:Tetratricopeptide repeat protein 5-like protein n=1 Tax=Sarcoptes scabiei TaxID=52283 RepID=A0A131ZVI9_SARSC|nr:tetratricopeptide repeat protein 5-like protein [Sarcoptes scabiei]